MSELLHTTFCSCLPFMCHASCVLGSTTTTTTTATRHGIHIRKNKTTGADECARYEDDKGSHAKMIYSQPEAVTF